MIKSLQGVRKPGVDRCGNQLIKKVVEAAGVEPASEKVRHEKNYVRFRFGSCRPPH